MATGLSFALNLLVVKLILVKFDFPPIQLNHDVNFYCGLLMLPLFLHYFDEIRPYLVYATFNFYVTNMGCVFMTLSIVNGKAGVCQAIENLKCLW